MINFDMADIANSTVFTNRVSCDTSDLLQHVFQEVVNDEDHDHELVTFLTGDGNGTQTIQLTRAQAAALSLTFEVGSASDQLPDAIVYQQCQNEILSNVENSNVEPQKSSVESEEINFNPTAQWTIDNSHKDDKISEHNEEINSTVNALNINANNQEPEELMLNLHDTSHQDNIQTILVQQTTKTSEESDLKASDHNEIQYLVGKNSNPNFSVDIMQPQVLQRLPVIFPSSQFILKPGKSIKRISAPNKINTCSNVISSACNTGSPVVLPKTTIQNSISSQIFKSIPITSYISHDNAIPAQLLNLSSISSRETVSDCNNDNNLMVDKLQSKNIGKKQIQPTVKTTATSIKNKNDQQYNLTKLTESSCLNVKPANSSEVNDKIVGSLLRSLQIPTQLLKTSVGKLSTGTILPKMANVNPSIILKSGSRSKTKLQSVSSASGNINRINHTISTPISILKPQTKIAFGNSTKQNVNFNSQNNITNANGVQAAKIFHTIVQQQNTLTENGKVVNDKRVKNTDISPSTPKVFKKSKIISNQYTMSPVTATSETMKTFDSTEKHIQIIQQGHAFHSSHKLTQTQLKQIAHVLQQRSQDSSVPNEKVVYRVVFPEELDLRIRNPINLFKGRGGKRGRPKKKATKSVLVDEESEETKDERKKHVARTRSGRLSRPPRHIMRDYKHLHHLDFTEPELDDSDGGYSDYNANRDKLTNGDVTKDLLTGYEGPKRKISDHFRCPTCNKIYLGRTRMAKHFEMHSDHGSPDQLPPATLESELKRPAFAPDQFKRKGKKRGPWAYITPEAKSERRQVKLKEALSACDNGEILKVAAKPVLNTQSLFDLMILKSERCLKTFFTELKILVEKAREQVTAMLTHANDGEKQDDDVLQLDDDLLCTILGLAPGVYNVNSEIFQKSSKIYNTSTALQEPPVKLQKVDDEECKENIDERLGRFTENSNLNISNFSNENKFDSINNCPEVLTALTLMPRNTSPTLASDKSNNISKLLISNTEIQNQISDNPGFQKIGMNSKNSVFKKFNSVKDELSTLNDNLPEITEFPSAYNKLDDNYDGTKLENLQQTFIKLEPMKQGFVKLEDGTVATHQKESSNSFDKLQNSFDILQNTQAFGKGFQKLISKVSSMSGNNDNCKTSNYNCSNKNICKQSDLPLMQTTVPIVSSCDASIFGGNDNLDITKIANYDLDILSNSSVMDKHLIMDDKLVEQLQLVDQSNLVDELVSERLKNMIPNNILENNLMNNNSNLDAELDFEVLSGEFNRNSS